MPVVKIQMYKTVKYHKNIMKLIYLLLIYKKSCKKIKKIFSYFRKLGNNLNIFRKILIFYSRQHMWYSVFYYYHQHYSIIIIYRIMMMLAGFISFQWGRVGTHPIIYFWHIIKILLIFLLSFFALKLRWENYQTYL